MNELKVIFYAWQMISLSIFRLIKKSINWFINLPILLDCLAGFTIGRLIGLIFIIGIHKFNETEFYIFLITAIILTPLWIIRIYRSIKLKKALKNAK